MFFFLPLLLTVLPSPTRGNNINPFIFFPALPLPLCTAAPRSTTCLLLSVGERYWKSNQLLRNQFLNTECAAICQNFGRLDYSQNHRISIEWTYVCKETNPWKIFNHLLMPFLVVFVNMTQITLSLFCNVCFCSKCLMIFSSQVFHLDQNLYYLHVCDVINIA